MLDVISTNPPPDYPPETEAERLARHAAVLRELTEITLSAARALGRQVADEAARENAAGAPVEGCADTAPSSASRSAALGAALAQVARAVRQSVALEARLHQDQEAHSFRWDAHRSAQAREARQERQTQAFQAALTRDEVQNRAKRIIRAEAPLSERERLYDLLNERLDDLPGEAGWLAQSTAQWIAKIRRDLGLGEAATRKAALVAQASVATAQVEVAGAKVDASAAALSGGDDPFRAAPWPRQRPAEPTRPRPGVADSS